MISELIMVSLKISKQNAISCEADAVDAIVVHETTLVKFIVSLFALRLHDNAQGETEDKRPFNKYQYTLQGMNELKVS